MHYNKDITLKVKLKDLNVLYILTFIGIAICFFNFKIGILVIIGVIIAILINVFFCYKIIISDASIKLFYLTKKNIEFLFNEITLIKIYFFSGRYSESYLEIFTSKKHNYIVTPLNSYLSLLYCILKIKGVSVKYYKNKAKPNEQTKVDCERVLKRAKERKILD